MAKILVSFKYNIDIKNRWDIKTTSGSTKILAYLKTNGYRKNRMSFQRLHRPGLTPAYGLRRAKVVFGSAFGSPLYLNISTKIFAIAYSYGECIIKSGRHIF